MWICKPKETGDSHSSPAINLDRVEVVSKESVGPTPVIYFWTGQESFHVWWFQSEKDRDEWFDDFMETFAKPVLSIRNFVRYSGRLASEMDHPNIKI